MKKIVLLFVLFVSIISCSFAHPGRTDSNGGHYDRSTGIYHYHNNGDIEDKKTKEEYEQEMIDEVLKVNDTSNDLQEQIYAKQNTISRLNNIIIENNKEIEKLKHIQRFMWVSFTFVFLIGLYVSYKVGSSKNNE